MAKATLPTNYHDDILNVSTEGKRKYRMNYNDDGTVSFIDVTPYDQEGSDFGAGDINATNQAVNESFDKNKLIRDMDAINALTEEGYAPDALALKDVNDSLNDEVLHYPDMTTQIYTTTWQNAFTWTATEDCWVYAVCSTNKSNNSAIIKLNGNSVVSAFDDDSSHTTQIGIFFPCKKGDVISKTQNGNTQGLMQVYGMRK